MKSFRNLRNPGFPAEGGSPRLRQKMLIRNYATRLLFAIELGDDVFRDTLREGDESLAGFQDLKNQLDDAVWKWMEDELDRVQQEASQRS
ncbi:hypothetical protein [Larkinella soli]|uniref:hypothetical protein n=1 Tax=Larkinella soli TaxID=1770527 RepID=UPI000FFB3BBD|nr:hypothetical protein [Larkinella soli]